METLSTVVAATLTRYPVVVMTNCTAAERSSTDTDAGSHVIRTHMEPSASMPTWHWIGVSAMAISTRSTSGLVSSDRRTARREPIVGVHTRDESLILIVPEIQIHERFLDGR